MTAAPHDRVPGAFALVAAAHLPWLAGRPGATGEDRVHEMLARRLVPLVDALDRLAGEGVRDVLTLAVSPLLAAQLDDPELLARSRTRAALPDGGGLPSAPRVGELLDTRWRGGVSPVLRSLADRGVVELLGGPLGHPLLPRLLPEVARFELEAGLTDSVLRYGARPRGCWLPECAWAPWLADLVESAGVGHLVVDAALVESAGGHPYAAWRLAGHGTLAVPRDRRLSDLVSGGLAAATQDAGPGWVGPLVEAVVAALTAAADALGEPGLVVAAYDLGADVPGGSGGLEDLVRGLRAAGVTLTTLGHAVDGGHVADELDLGEGSWAADGGFATWTGAAAGDLAREGWWVQRRFVDILGRERDRATLTARRPDLDQLARTMTLLLSSDWAAMAGSAGSAQEGRAREGELRRAFHGLAQLVEDGRAFDAAAEAGRQREAEPAFPKLDARRAVPDRPAPA